MARGVRSQLTTIGTPRAIKGKSRLLNPYECEIGITPKFRSTSEISIVSQICLQSASSCSLRKRTSRGVAVVPEVNLKSVGGLSPQSVIPLFAATENAASDCSLGTDSSMGRKTFRFLRQTKNDEGQS